jgi:hypothetical protein
MTPDTCNCIICAQEFNANELHSLALSKVNITNFKVCQACFNYSNPAEDYREVRDIVFQYVKFASLDNK